MIVEGKKSLMILVKSILEEYSDENHFLTQKEIVDLLYSDYGLEVERKAVGRAIRDLDELEICDINKQERGGVAIFSRLYDDTEVQFITDAALSSRGITSSQAQRIIEKSNSVLSKYKRKSYSYVKKTSQINRSENNNVFFNLELINDAIKQNKKISFQYAFYDLDLKMRARKGGYFYKVSPYYVINNFGRYYLLCHYRDDYSVLITFRIDYLLELKILDENALPLKSFPGYEKFEVAEYMNNHIYLFNGDVCEARIKVDKQTNIINVVDWFGKKIKVTKENDGIYIDLVANENSLIYWMMQYGEHFTLISPDYLVEKLKESLKTQLNKYDKKD